MPTPTLRASPPPAPTRAPAPTPTPTVYTYLSARPGPLEANAFAIILADDLVVRSAPSVAIDSEILTPYLQRGTRMFLLDGPVAGSGYEWYQVDPLPPDSATDLPGIGWVAAASREGAPWIGGLVLDCPALPVSLATLLTLDPTERIACYSGVTLSFRAQLVRPRGIRLPPLMDTRFSGDCAAKMPERFLCAVLPGDTPADENPLVLRDPIQRTLSDLDLHVAQTSLVPAELQGELLVRVAGHFDDPASADCRAPTTTECHAPADVPLVTDSVVVMTCRTDFIVTSLTVLQ